MHLIMGMYLKQAVLQAYQSCIISVATYQGCVTRVAIWLQYKTSNIRAAKSGSKTEPVVIRGGWYDILMPCKYTTQMKSQNAPLPIIMM